jgi:hypothetical protein
LYHYRVVGASQVVAECRSACIGSFGVGAGKQVVNEFAVDVELNLGDTALMG